MSQPRFTHRDPQWHGPGTPWHDLHTGEDRTVGAAEARHLFRGTDGVLYDCSAATIDACKKCGPLGRYYGAQTATAEPITDRRQATLDGWIAGAQ
jgi:hypothetical protein